MEAERDVCDMPCPHSVVTIPCALYPSPRLSLPSLLMQAIGDLSAWACVLHAKMAVRAIKGSSAMVFALASKGHGATCARTHALAELPPRATTMASATGATPALASVRVTLITTGCRVIHALERSKEQRATATACATTELQDLAIARFVSLLGMWQQGVG